MALIPEAIGSSPQFSGGTPDVLSFSPLTDTNYTLPATYTLNTIVSIYNYGTANLSLKAADGTSVRILAGGTSGQFLPAQSGPTTSSHWVSLGTISTDQGANGIINHGGIQLLKISLKGSTSVFLGKVVHCGHIHHCLFEPSLNTVLHR